VKLVFWNREILFPAMLRFNTSLAFQGIFSIAKAQRAVQGVFEVKIYIIRPTLDIAEVSDSEAGKVIKDCLG
jgi:hypothetical protein